MLELLYKPVCFILIKKSHLSKHIHKPYDKVFSIVYRNKFIPKVATKEGKDIDKDVLLMWLFKYPSRKSPEHCRVFTETGEITMDMKPDFKSRREIRDASAENWMGIWRREFPRAKRLWRR